MSKQTDILSLEKEMTDLDNEIIEEETNNVSINYSTINQKLEEYQNEIQYKNSNPYGQIDSYEEHGESQIKKYRNRDIYEKINQILPYANNDSLYCAHIITKNSDFYMMDGFYPSQVFTRKDDSKFILVNLNSPQEKQKFSFWHEPDKHPEVISSRNIIIQNKKLINVDTIYDKSSTYYSQITDLYLRKALKRNKYNNHAQSIIMTIQKNQNRIRIMDENASFIVQGCAGSGKTMILLHRLNYLNFNQKINSNNFLYLTPGSDYKSFINSMSTNYKINKNQILSIDEYYQSLLNKKNNAMYNELIFDSSYLSKIYSIEFITECYKDLINLFFDQITSLESTIMSKIKKLSTKENSLLTNEINKNTKTLIKSINKEIRTLKKYVEIDKMENIDDYNRILDQIQKAYNDKQSENNGTEYKNIEVLDKINTSKSKIIDIYLSLSPKLESDKKVLEEAHKQFLLNYSEILNSFNELKNYVDEQTNALLDNVNLLEPNNDTLYAISQKATVTINILIERGLTYNNIYNKLGSFKTRTKDNFKSYISQALFRICKKKILNEYDVKIADSYKHYWYLSLACKYLTDDLSVNTFKYIFIDEAQDLSPAEILLIKNINYKYSSRHEEPTLNLFGDVNQNISSHGVNNWTDLNLNIPIYTLNENFRNTNQIIDYCNKKLPIKMDKVSVDMEDVLEYNNLAEAVKNHKELKKNTQFIVKDEFAKEDLLELLKKRKSIIDYEIYTVKNVKGLEFRSVCVFDRDMIDNEKYIAYTRALANLIVIKELPKSKTYKTMIIQGNDDTENITKELQ